jgi:hypothetical protein
MTEEEEFFAWLDGELAPADAKRVEARVAANPVLADEARAHRAMAAGLRGAFEPVMTPKDDVIDFAARRSQAAARSPAKLPHWAAIAATLVAGIGLGTLVDAGRGTGSPVKLEGGQIVAAGSLEQTLTRQLASVNQQGAGTRIGLTFRNEEGRLCRTFSGTEASGLACRNGDEWRIEGLYGASGSSSGDYRMAAGPDTRVTALAEGMMVGDPLDAAGEAAAKQSGWK